MSRDNGSTWAPLAFPTAATASAMYIPNPDTVYVGTTDGRVLRTTWRGTAWGALTALTTPRSAARTSATCTSTRTSTHSDLGDLPRIRRGRVFRSDDGGSTLDRLLAAGLPTIPMNAIEVDAANGQRIWVAADLGVYQSLDAGATWATFSDSLPNCYIGDLLFHRTPGCCAPAPATAACGKSRSTGG